MARLERRPHPGAASGRPSGAERYIPHGLLNRVLWMLARLSSILLLLAGWEIFARSGRVTAFMLPPLSAVLARIATDAVGGDLFLNIGVTLYRALLGFFIATVGGIALGIAMSRNALMRWFFDPLVSVGFPMPKIAFLPIIILWLGLYDVPKVTMVVFDAIFPVITGTIAGISSVEHQLLWSARNMGASEREVTWQIVLPAALPQILTGLQVALPIALIVAIVTEMAMGGYGMGGAMMQASRFANSPGVFAGIAEIAVVGYVLVKGLGLVRRRLLMWHQEAMAPSTV
jgi:ABC-type nitrate/sulfonate/bicarbonate transport system permease component